MPSALEARRVAYLSRRTGPQLRRACEQFQESKKVGDDALLRIWLKLADRYAVSRRALVEAYGGRDGVKAPDFILAIGDAAAAVAVLREKFADAKITAVEMSDARIDAASQVVGGPGITFTRSLADVAKRQAGRFDLVASAWHLSELGGRKACDASLALLWGCVRPGGLLAVVEDAQDEPFV